MTEYKAINEYYLRDIPKEPIRDYIFHDIAMTAVRQAMGECRKHKVVCCDLCPVAKGLDEYEPCKEDCMEHGFASRESMTSAMKKIAKVLEGRT